jgi:nucleoside-diphosphate-sugar epimerase
MGEVILVTGATGFIGGHLVDMLVSRGYRVRCFVRKPNEHLKSLEVEVIKGDITNRGTLKNATRSADIICHLAAILGRYGVPDELYWKVNVEGTKNILEECLKGSIKHFIYFSSADVVGPLKDPNILANETFPYNPSNIYELTKAEAEKLVLKYYHEFGLPVTIIRPAFVYGPRDKHLFRLFKAVQEGKFVLIGNGESFIHPTYISDVIQASQLCLTKKRGTGEIYIVAGERPVTWRQLVEVIADVCSSPPPRLSIPIWLSKLLAFLMERISRIYGSEPRLTTSMVKYLTESRAYDITKAKKELGYKPLRLEEGIKKTVEWYVNNGYIKLSKSEKIHQRKETQKNRVRILNLNNKYHVEIFGFGEIYEIVSVEMLMKKLKRKYGDGVLLLAQNKDHSGEGLTLEELIGYAKLRNLLIVKAGYVDSPPWFSKRRESPRSIINFAPILFITRKIFYILSNLEKFTASKYKAHMIYVFLKAKKKDLYKFLQRAY